MHFPDWCMCDSTIPRCMFLRSLPRRMIVSMSVCLAVCQYVYISICLFECLSDLTVTSLGEVGLCVTVSLCVCVCVFCLSVWLFVDYPRCLCLCLFAFACLFLAMCVSVPVCVYVMYGFASVFV